MYNMEHIAAKELENCFIWKFSDKEIKRPGSRLLQKYVHVGNGHRQGMKQCPIFPFRVEDNEEMGIPLDLPEEAQAPRVKQKWLKQ